MLRFLAGFGVASLIWGGFVFSYSRGWIDISLEPEAPQDVQSAPVESAGADDSHKPKRGHQRHGGGGHKTRGPGVSGDSNSGDDLNEDQARSLDMKNGGGEEQLAGTEIEKGFDGAFSQIRRCLILAASDEPAKGKLIFG